MGKSFSKEITDEVTNQKIIYHPTGCKASIVDKHVFV